MANGSNNGLSSLLAPVDRGVEVTGSATCPSAAGVGSNPLPTA